MQAMLMTDDRGMFRIMGLPAGEYIVGATPTIEHGELVRDESWEANMVGSSLIMTFYPSTVLATKATTIRVQAGEERAGVDITTATERGTSYPVSFADVTIDVQLQVLWSGSFRKETNERVRRALFWSHQNGCRAYRRMSKVGGD